MKTRTHRQPIACLLVGLMAITVESAAVRGASQDSERTRGPRGSLIQVAVLGSGEHVVVSLVGDQVLTGSLKELTTPPFRVFVDLAGVVPQVDPVTAVGRGGVERVRVALNQSAPPVTRVVLDLSERTTYRIERDPANRELRIILGPASSVDTVKSAVAVAPAFPAPEPFATIVEDYATWFIGTALRVEHLLLPAPPAAVGGVAATEAPRALAWQAVRHELDMVTPPIALQDANDLLRTAISLGYAGAGEGGGESSTTNRAAARSGSLMLLALARERLDTHLMATASVDQQ